MPDDKVAEIAAGLTTHVWLIATYIRSITDDPSKREQMVGMVAAAISNVVKEQERLDAFKGVP